MRNLVVLLGVPIDNLSYEEAVNQIDAMVLAGRQTGKTHQVATVNVDFLVKAASDPELRYLLQEADLATADGMPLLWAARLLRAPLKQRVAGVDLVPMLVQRAAQKGYSIYFFGSAPGVAEIAARKLVEQYPKLKIAGIASPPYTSVLEMDAAMLAEIRAAKPDILFVALGNPKQEKWIGMYGRELGIPVMIGVGGSLDMIAGQVSRAPVWMQKSGLEWVYRLMQEPRRLWKRYGVDLVVFSTYFLRQWWATQRRRSVSKPEQAGELVKENGRTVINLKGRLDADNLAIFVQTGSQTLALGQDLVVNMAEVAFIDSAGIGALVSLAKQARSCATEMALAALPPQVMSTLSLLRLTAFFTIYPTVASALAGHPGDQIGSSQSAVMPYKKVTRGQVTWMVVPAPRRFDAFSAPEVSEMCLSLLEERPNIVLDLAETVILASAGLAVLLNLHKKALQKGGELRIANCSQDVMRTIRLVRMDTFLKIDHDRSPVSVFSA
jgi:N-acetylglucosaminyldiphosphoundecaprenol N-acetyl-beta-D-mannosaminyltransferase